MSMIVHFEVLLHNLCGSTVCTSSHHLSLPFFPHTTLRTAVIHVNLLAKQSLQMAEQLRLQVGGKTIDCLNTTLREAGITNGDTITVETNYSLLVDNVHLTEMPVHTEYSGAVTETEEDCMSDTEDACKSELDSSCPHIQLLEEKVLGSPSSGEPRNSRTKRFAAQWKSGDAKKLQRDISSFMKFEGSLDDDDCAPAAAAAPTSPSKVVKFAFANLDEDSSSSPCTKQVPLHEKSRTKSIKQIFKLGKK